MKPVLSKRMKELKGYVRSLLVEAGMTGVFPGSGPARDAFPALAPPRLELMACGIT